MFKHFNFIYSNEANALIRIYLLSRLIYMRHLDKLELQIVALIRGTYMTIDEMYLLPADEQLERYDVLYQQIVKMFNMYIDYSNQLKRNDCYKQNIKIMDHEIDKLDKYFEIHLEKIG